MLGEFKPKHPIKKFSQNLEPISLRGRGWSLRDHHLNPGNYN
jgi:hypothetical protein